MAWEHSFIPIDEETNKLRNRQPQLLQITNDYAERIIRGEKYLKRLSPEEEQGRIEGGKINVEATLILGRGKKTESEFPQREKQLKILDNVNYLIKSFKTMQKELSVGKSTLNDYHQKRNKVALEGAEQMSKQPYSLEQMREQAMSVKKLSKEDHFKKNW